MMLSGAIFCYNNTIIKKEEAKKTNIKYSLDGIFYDHQLV